MSHQGHVKFFSESKGFGFIQMDGCPTDVFVASKDIIGNPLYQDDLVSFDLDCNKKGKAAKNVRGGTGNPFKGKMKGLLNPATKGGGKGGYEKGEGKSSGMTTHHHHNHHHHQHNFSSSDHHPSASSRDHPGGHHSGGGDEDEEMLEGKANNGKGILPGGRHCDAWYKGGYEAAVRAPVNAPDDQGPTLFEQFFNAGTTTNVQAVVAANQARKQQAQAQVQVQAHLNFSAPEFRPSGPPPGIPP